MMAIISIGIFAYNESKGIADMLRDLFLQDLITGGAERGDEIEIVCVPNGCTDDTAAVAKRALTEGTNSLDGATGLTWRVDELEQPGKANAWNYYIHEASRPDAEFIICLDADIAMPQRECLSGVLAQLTDDPRAYVAVDEPVKDIMAQGSSGFLTRLNRTVTRHKKMSRQSGHNAIAGSLFCGRATILRKIWLPSGLVRVMDGFIRAMVVTNCFTTEEEHFRLVCADDCYHIFYAYNTLSVLYRHNRKLLVGIVVNAMIYDYLWQHSTPERHAGVLIRELNEDQPDWLLEVVRSKLSRTRRWGILRWHILNPIRRINWRGAPHMLPLAILQSILRVPVALSANRYLRSCRFEW